MSERLFSPSWHRVASLTPRLRSHTQVVRQQFRGEVWYVLRDPSNDRFHRFGVEAQRVIGLMDGHRTVAEIWERASDVLADDAPTQDELIQLLGQLHASDVLLCEMPPDAAELFERFRKQQRRELLGRLLNPFAMRFHLVDPDRFLVRTDPLVRPFFGWLGALIWLAVVVPAAVGVVTHWPALTENALDQLFTPGQILVIWLLFPVIKSVHELGHGYAARLQGGEVHDMGIMFLVFSPVPYVDASSSWAFDDKWRRALVGAAGMLVELFVAAIAYFVWAAAEPGAVRAVAYNVLVIAGATTLLFNLNPLLRFDGYYVLSDLIEIPNLRSRANRYLGHLWETRVFGVRDESPPPVAPGEPAWLVGYAVAAFAYRLFIIAAILLWVLEWNLALGLGLAAISMAGWIGKPLVKGVKYLTSSPKLRHRRPRALGVTAGIAFGSALLLLAVPLPLRTHTEGVVWIPEEALVRAGTEGFVERVLVRPGAWVEADELLVVTADPELQAEIAGARGRVRELEGRLLAALVEDRARAQIAEGVLEYERKRLARLEERQQKLSIRSSTSGELVMRRPDDLHGRFVAHGQLLGYVLDLDTLIVRAVVSQHDVDLVRQRTGSVAVRIAGRLAEVHEASIRRIVPAANDRLPSTALGSVGGGEVPVDTRGGEVDQAVESLFEVELEVAAGEVPLNGGGRVYVRFDHGSEPLAWQWARRLRQVFLERLHV